MRPTLRQTVALGIGVILGIVPTTVLAQFGRAPVRGQAPADLNRLVHELSERVQHLTEDIASDLRQTREGRHLLQDAEELAASVEELHESLHGRADVERVRRSYANIDSAWHHLREGFARLGSTPAIDRAVARVEEADARLHQALRLDQPTGLVDLSRRLAGEVARLRQVMEAEIPDDQAGRYLIADGQELGDSVLEFQETARRQRDLHELRQSYSWLDTTWHRMRNDLARYRSRELDRSVARLDGLDAQFHQTLGLRAYPPGFFDTRRDAARPAPAPAEPLPPRERPVAFSETQRLAFALDSRAETLAAVVRADLADARNFDHIYSDVTRLDRAADAFYDALEQGRPQQELQAAFAPLGTLSACLAHDFQALDEPDRVTQAWQAYTASEALLRQEIGLPAPPPEVHIVQRPVAGEPPPLVGLADALVAEVQAFLQVWGPTHRQVPQGDAMLADAQRLQVAAIAFREEAARGDDPGRLALSFQAVEEPMSRLARRVNRVARGRIGPNITQVQKLAGLVGQIHNHLAIPGPAPLIVLPQGGDD